MTVDNHEFRQRSKASPSVVYPSWQSKYRRHGQDVSDIQGDRRATCCATCGTGVYDLLGISLMHESGVSSYEGSDTAFEA